MGGQFMEGLHEVASNGMMAVVVIHIAGVIVSSWLHRENLVLAMITGWKKLRNENPAG
jgi:cytochrome b